MKDWLRTIPVKLVILVIFWGLWQATLPAEDKQREQRLQNTGQKKYKGKGDLIFLRDFGTDDIGYLVLPQSRPIAGLLMVPDSFGLNSDLKKQCDALAEEGFLVLAVDIYNGKTAIDPKDAFKIRDQISSKAVDLSINTGVNFFEKSPRYQMKDIVLVGVGFSSDLTILYAARYPKIKAVTLMEPIRFFPKNAAEQLKMPLQIVISNNSPTYSVLLKKREEYEQSLKYVLNVRVEQIESNKGGVHRHFYGNSRMWNPAVTFWNKTLKNGGEKKANVFQRLIESID